MCVCAYVGGGGTASRQRKGNLSVILYSRAVCFRDVLLSFFVCVCEVASLVDTRV